MTDLTDESKQKKRRLTDAQVKRQARDDLRFVMTTADGRRFVWRLLVENCREFTGSYAGVGNNDETNLREGRKAVGYDIKARLRIECPALFVEMFTENFVKPEETRAREKEIHQAQPTAESIAKAEASSAGLDFQPGSDGEDDDDA